MDTPLRILYRAVEPSYRETRYTTRLPEPGYTGWWSLLATERRNRRLATWSPARISARKSTLRVLGCDVATDRGDAPSGKLTMIARPNQIAEEKGGERRRKEYPRNRRRKFSTLRSRSGRRGISPLSPLQMQLWSCKPPQERYNSCESVPKKEIPGDSAGLRAQSRI